MEKATYHGQLSSLVGNRGERQSKGHDCHNQGRRGDPTLGSRGGRLQQVEGYFRRSQTPEMFFPPFAPRRRGRGSARILRGPRGRVCHNGKRMGDVPSVTPPWFAPSEGESPFPLGFYLSRMTRCSRLPDANLGRSVWWLCRRFSGRREGAADIPIVRVVRCAFARSSPSVYYVGPNTSRVN